MRNFSRAHQQTTFIHKVAYLVGYVVTLAPNQIDFFNTRRDGEERKKNCRKKTVIEIAKVIARNAQEEEKTKDASDTL